MEAAERALLSSTVDAAVANAAAPGAAPVSVDDALDDLGWREMLAAEPRDAIEIVFRALGAHNATATALDDVLASALGHEPGPDVAVVLPPFGSSAPPGHIDGARMHAAGLATRRASTADRLLVVSADRSSLQIASVVASNAAISDVAVSTIGGIDPAGQWCSVRVDASTDTPALATSPLDGATWESAIAAGRRALAHQTVGAARGMLDLARAHAIDRVQFGRPVAGFQAVRHRLADALVAIEALEACLDAAWDEMGSETAALAKAVAGKTGGTVATHCQQVLAGVGFTTDHPFHRFLKRTMMLDGLLGSADEIVLQLGRALLADRTVPTLLEL